MRVLLGECEFDSGRRLLLRHGRAEPLSPKAFQLLELLLDRRPEAVAKVELLERLWPGTFVSDASLYNLVAEVRAALGDASRATRFIRTVPRYGYAFHGDARPAPAVDVSRPRPSGACLLLGRREWLLPEGSNLVGRDRDCAIRVDSATVSRHHARILVGPDETTVEDLESKNGTQVNRQRVEQRVALSDGDQIRFGSVTVTYRILRSLPSTVTRRA
ncbi:MAG TPA: FHA domain-containing protein [Vicinamibacteria bacterium]|nr:FHA domain-containing protein [Vicinamibacteria bacterium]